MKKITYYWTEGGRLTEIDPSHKLIQGIRWHKDETLKIEVWPFDLKIGPCTQIPYAASKQKKQQWVKEIRANTAEYRREKAEGSNQEPLIRIDKTSSPYSQEFTKRDDARNRAHLSQKLPKGRAASKDTSTQDDAPF
jgi:hypothetical protein